MVYQNVDCQFTIEANMKGFTQVPRKQRLAGPTEQGGFTGQKHNFYLSPRGGFILQITNISLTYLSAPYSFQNATP